MGKYCVVRGRIIDKCWDRTEAKKGGEQNLNYKENMKRLWEHCGKKREGYTMRFV